MTRALALSTDGFYYALIPGCLSALTTVGIRAHMTKIIDVHEMGKVFSLVAMNEANTPLLATEVFTLLFDATIDSNPKLQLIVVALILLVPAIVITWIHCYTELPDYNRNSYTIKSTDTNSECNKSCNESKV